MKKKIKYTALATSIILAGLSAGAQASAHDAASAMPDMSNKNILVGFWHNWASKSDGYKQGSSADVALSAVPEAYNVVTVAFMTGNGIPSFKPYNMSDAGFRAEVSALNAQGRAVLLSLGGADAHIQLSQGDSQKFADEIIRLVELYGFDGLDIDLEGGAITAGANVTEIPEALKIVKHRYPHFIISMAPEFPHLRVNGAYEGLIKNLEGYYDFISPQYYNQAGDGIWVEGHGNLQQNNDNAKADFLFYLTDSIIHGTRGYVHIPADKFAIGLPSNPDAAANGYVKNAADVRTALERLDAQGTPIKGLMTWSVNWDTGRDASGNPYGYEFVNRYAEMVGERPVAAPDAEAPSKPGKPVASAANGSVTLQWVAATDNVGVNHYEVWRDGKDIGQPTLPEFRDTTIKPASTYSYHVVAVDKAGNRSAISDETLITTEADEEKPVQDTQAPSVPQGLHASQITETSVKISWQASSDNVAVTGYQVWRDGRLLTQVNATQWSDSGLKAASDYLYHIVATDAAGNQSAKSQTLRVTTKPQQDNGGDSASWSSQTVYKGGEIVNWKGSQYKAKWWTQNNEPGTNDVWEDLHKETGREWKVSTTYVAGDKATYAGKTWVAKWWTKGDLPGNSDVWKTE
ncbi:chitinase [Pantoea agglomerans]|nr:glycosyl hydrolase family 18 protein [Pantoea agglomerans]PEI02233.1 chitinase [Pantoea agglomerans]